MAEIRKNPAWSFTAMKDYLTCPRKYLEEKVLKNFPFVETDHVRYGNEVHKACELYIKEDKPLGPHKRFTPALDALRNIGGEFICEKKMALNRDSEPTGYFAKNVWVRGAADLLIIKGDTAYCVDYKTGSAKYPDPDQLNLMSYMVFCHFPEVNKVKAALLFLVHNKLKREEYNRKDMPKMLAMWEHRYSSMNSAHESEDFPPSPNGLCRDYCPVKHCEFNGV